MTPRVLKALFAVTLALGALGMPAGALASNDRAPIIIQARISTLSIRTLLEQRGYTKIGRILLSGAVYKVVARDRRGRRVKLFVDPQTARILRKVLICE
ncbi:MAG: PepSY domain-containing protein [Proteobacteria bacterium]|nr:PepSY domain-containing protein [Pseudomonadota bacterium]